MAQPFPFLRSHAHGVTVAIRLTPKAGSDRVLGIHDGALKVAVSAPPVEGAANEALIKFLSKLLHVPKQAISISSGEKSRSKVLVVSGARLADLEAKFSALQLSD